MFDEKPKADVSGDVLGLGKAAVQLIKTGEDFLMKLIGPWLDEKGGELADPIRERRRRNAAAIAGQAAELLGDQEPKQVPGRVLFTLLNAASNESEPQLQQMWASLLANAADPDKHDISPAFVSILKNLSPFEAQLLTSIYLELVSGDLTRIHIADDAPKGGNGIPFGDVEALADNLNRLGLVQATYSGYAISAPFVNVTRSYKTDQLKLTKLGVKFMEACSRQISKT